MSFKSERLNGLIVISTALIANASLKYFSPTASFIGNEF